jgi:hypothetical protein
VKGTLKIKKYRKVNKQQVMKIKERAAALRGKIGFAKMVWKEGYQIGVDLFS